MDHNIAKALRMMELSDPHGYREVLEMIKKIDEAEGVSKARDNFLDFAKLMWPVFIAGRHHKIMADLFEKVVDGKKDRVIINLGPRHTKSEFASWLLPAWFLGKYPDKKIIQASNVNELATNFGRRVRNLVASEEYQRIFPGTELRADSHAAGRWETSAGGVYHALGVGSAAAGKGADLLIIDDPHSEQEAITAMGDSSVFDKVYDWYVTGPRQRLQPNAKIIVVQTRWAMNDLTGRLLRAQAQAGEDENVDRWDLVELPAMLPSGEPLWPEFWTKSALERTKNALPPAQWSAQYLQQPTSEMGALIKREWWKRWTHPKPPKCHLTMISGDLAFTKNERSNYSAFTTWGIFRAPGDGDKAVDNIILLDAWRDRMEFPELKREVYKYYKEKKPDMFILENKAAGISLIQELRAVGIPVMAQTPARGNKLAGANDKVVRVNAVADIFASGMVWAPLTHWADEVIEEVAAFPMGEHDDYTDTVSQAMARFRQGGFVKLATDWEDEAMPIRRPVAYY